MRAAGAAKASPALVQFQVNIRLRPRGSSLPLTLETGFASMVALAPVQARSRLAAGGPDCSTMRVCLMLKFKICSPDGS